LEKSIKAEDKKKKKNFFKSWVLVLPYIHRQGYIMADTIKLWL
jgi:hypothetical protein